MLKLVDEDKHHTHWSAPVIPEDYDLRVAAIL